MQFEADYFDGISPLAKKVLVSVETHELIVKSLATAPDAPEFVLRYTINDCHVQARLGGSKRLIDCPDGARIETHFQALESCLPAKPRNRFWQAVHYAENHLALVGMAFVGILLCGFALLTYGIPVMAKYTAGILPVSVEQRLGQETLTTLDDPMLGWFQASKLTDAQKKSITQALQTLCSRTKTCPTYTLEFRKSPKIGANAFALPGGTVVMTDELVNLAKNNDELVAVLVHELGHVKNKHALRQTLEGTISGIVIIAITGDVSSIASSLPAMMLNMKYGRNLETEADEYALNALRQACLPTQAFATILLRLSKSVGGDTVPEIVSSHPDTKKRVIPFYKTHPCKT